MIVIVLAVIGTIGESTKTKSIPPSPTAPADAVAAARARVASVVAMSACSPSSARVKKMIADHPTWENGQMANVLCKRVAIGMTGTQVRLAWGAPETINTTTYASGDHDQWVYGNNYVYLEDGIVTAVQTSK